jgi:hypothetical protein
VARVRRENDSLDRFLILLTPGEWVVSKTETEVQKDDGQPAQQGRRIEPS